MADKPIRRLTGASSDNASEPQQQVRQEPPSFSVDAWVAIAGVGARKIREVKEDGSVTYREDERDKKSDITIGKEEAQRRLRALVAKDVAKQLRDTLATPAEPNTAEDEYDRSRAYKAALKSNNLHLMLETLRGVYRHPSPGYPEEQIEDLLAEAVFSELGGVLGTKPGVLKGQARKGAGQTVLPDRSAELAAHKKVPELAKHEAVGAFFVERSLAVGEFAVGGLELPARPGVWFAYYLDNEDPPDEVENDEYPPSKLVVVHSDAFPRVSDLLTRMEQEAKELPIEGASMAAADADAAKDRAFQRAIESAGHELIQGRGVQVRLGGDGYGVAHVAREADLAVLVSVDMM